jgi:hypothetical protein
MKKAILESGAGEMFLHRLTHATSDSIFRKRSPKVDPLICF